MLPLKMKIFILKLRRMLILFIICKQESLEAKLPAAFIFCSIQFLSLTVAILKSTVISVTF